MLIMRSRHISAHKSALPRAVKILPADDPPLLSGLPSPAGAHPHEGAYSGAGTRLRKAHCNTLVAAVPFSHMALASVVLRCAVRAGVFIHAVTLAAICTFP